MKKGFTLIELLAVIVILAVVSLIATPVVLGIIKDAKESANLRSAEAYIHGVENEIMASELENINIPDGTFDIMPDGNICLGNYENNICDNILKINLSGTKPTGKNITIENKKVANAILVINGILYSGTLIIFLGNFCQKKVVLNIFS